MGSLWLTSAMGQICRHPHVEKDHLVKLLRQLLLGAVAPTQDVIGRNMVNAATVPTLLGTGSFSLLACT